MRKLSTVGLIAFIPCVLFGCVHEEIEEPGQQVPLSGIVYDSARAPQAGCFITSTNRPQENAISTDETGRFETHVFPGKQVISVLCAQKLTKEFELDVPSTGETDLKVVLE